MVRAQTGYKRRSGSETAEPRLLPYQRKVKHLEDYWENLDPEGREGYCWCGCGEQTSIRRHTDAQRGMFAGEPAAFLPGHAVRQMKPRGKVPPEKVETIRYLWNNSAMSGNEIAEHVGLTGSFTRAIAANTVASYYDPEYVPAKRAERLEMIFGTKTLTCEICGTRFKGKGPHRDRHVCGKRECMIEYRRLHTPEMTEEVKRVLSEKAKERHARGVYKNKQLPPTELQQEWTGHMPSKRPEWLPSQNWDALYAHVVDKVTYEDMAREQGGTATKYKQRAKRAAEDLRRGGPRPGPPYPKKSEAAKRRWRNQRGEFS